MSNDPEFVKEEKVEPAVPSSKSGPGFWSWLMVFALVLAAVLIFGGQTFIKTGKSYWARHKASQAVEALEEKEYLIAAKALADANRFNREEPAVLRATLSFLQETRSDPRGMLITLKTLAETGEATSADMLELGQTHLDLGEVAAARKVFQGFDDAMRQSKDGLELLAGIYRVEGETFKAEETLREALLKDKDSPDSKLRLAVLDYSNTFPEIHRRARATMWELADKQDKTALTAIRFLAEDDDLAATEVDRLLAVVEAHPDAGLQDRLNVLSAVMRLVPQRREQILQQETRKFEGGEGEEMMIALQWLAKEKQHARLLQLVPPNVASRSAQIFPLVAQALGEEGRWADLQRLLTSGDPLPVSQGRIHVWLAECASQLNPSDYEAPQDHLLKAVETALKQEDRGTLASAAQVADRIGLYDLSIRCYENLAVLVPALEQQMFEKIYDVAKNSRDTERMLTVTADLVDRVPTSGVFRDRYNYLRLLLGEELEVVEGTLKTEDSTVRIEGASHRIPLSFMQALASFRLRKAEELDEALGRLKGEMDFLGPGQRAVAAGLLAVNGDDVQAFRISERIQPTSLLEEEAPFWIRAQN